MSARTILKFAPARARELLLASVILNAPTVLSASPQQANRRYTALPRAPDERFAGEMSYEFDSVVNRTTATYRASLDKRDLVHRLFFPRPDVHTIIVSYDYAGRIAPRVPDSVRIVFKADEYRTAASEAATGSCLTSGDHLAFSL